MIPILLLYYYTSLQAYKVKTNKVYTKKVTHGLSWCFVIFEKGGFMNGIFRFLSN